MMKHARWLILSCLALCLLWSSWAGAQAPTTMAYQGRLLSAAGAPVAATTSVVFSIYAAASGGSAVWTETISVTPDANGVFTVPLGATSALNTTVFDGTVRYLGIKAGADAEMTPRQALSSVPYALRSGAAAAPASIEGVANNGGNIDLVPGAGLTITGNDAANTVTLTPTAGGMHPIAYGVVATNGTIANAGSGNWTCSWNSTSNWYQIAITGFNYTFYDQLTLIQPAGGSGASSARFFTIDANGSLLVRPWLHDGTVSPFVFQFVVYELPGMKRVGTDQELPEGTTEAELFR
jgi:hypothetical protein